VARDARVEAPLSLRHATRATQSPSQHWASTDALVGACSKPPRVHVSRPTHIARCWLVGRHLPDPQGQWAVSRRLVRPSNVRHRLSCRPFIALSPPPAAVPRPPIPVSGPRPAVLAAACPAQRMGLTAAPAAVPVPPRLLLCRCRWCSAASPGSTATLPTSSPLHRQQHTGWSCCSPVCSTTSMSAPWALASSVFPWNKSPHHSRGTSPHRHVHRSKH
jgi:hypothetical protein